MIVKVIKNTYTAEPLYQWDINQVLRVYGLSLARVPEVHFINQAMSKAIVRQARMDDKGVVTVDVPNSLLQKPYTITAYICGYNGTTFETHHKLDIPVNKRPKPADYTLTNDPEVYSFKALENAVQNALHDLSNAEATLKNTTATIDVLVDNSVKAALPGFLDETLTSPNKAASASEVGRRFLETAKTVTYTATVTNNWAAVDGYYSQSIPVQGITADDNPIVDVASSEDNDANLLYVEAMSKVFRITTEENSIKVWAKEAVEIAFPIQLKVVR